MGDVKQTAREGQALGYSSKVNIKQGPREGTYQFGKTSCLRLFEKLIFQF